MAEIEKRFKLGNRVCKPAQYIKEVDARNGPVCSLIRQTLPQYPNIMAIGMFEKHAFYIKDIKKISNLYLCGHCSQSFTQACTLQRHADRCTQRVTQVKCQGDTVEAPQSAYEKAFYSSCNASNVAIRWLEYKSQQLDVHIHHAKCGHGGERWIKSAPVDGIAGQTVLQFHSCHWHGCPSMNPMQTVCTKQPSSDIKLSETPNSISWLCGNATHLGKPPPPQSPKTKPILSTHYCVRLRSLYRQEKGPLLHNFPHLRDRAHPHFCLHW